MLLPLWHLDWSTFSRIEIDSDNYTVRVKKHVVAADLDKQNNSYTESKASHVNQMQMLSWPNMESKFVFREVSETVATFIHAYLKRVSQCQYMFHFHWYLYNFQGISNSSKKYVYTEDFYQTCLRLVKFHFIIY